MPLSHDFLVLEAACQPMPPESWAWQPLLPTPLAIVPAEHSLPHALFLAVPLSRFQSKEWKAEKERRRQAEMGAPPSCSLRQLFQLAL